MGCFFLLAQVRGDKKGVVTWERGDMIWHMLMPLRSTHSCSLPTNDTLLLPIYQHFGNHSSAHCPAAYLQQQPCVDSLAFAMLWLCAAETQVLAQHGPDRTGALGY